MEEKLFKTAVEEANASVPRGKVKAEVREIEKSGGLIRTAFNNSELGTAKNSIESNENVNQTENNAEPGAWKNALNSLNGLNIKENFTAAMNAIIPELHPRTTISSSVDPFVYGNETRDFKTGLQKDIVIPLDEFLRNLPAPVIPTAGPQSKFGDVLSVDRPIVCCPLEQAGSLFSAPTNTPAYLNPPMFPNLYLPPYPPNPWDPYLFPGLFPFGNDIFGEETLKQSVLPFHAPNGPNTSVPENNNKGKKRKSTKKKKKKKKRTTEEGFEPSFFSWSHPANRKSKWWEVWNKMEGTALKKHHALDQQEFIRSSPGPEALMAPSHRVIRGNEVICTCGRVIPRPIVAHMHSNKVKNVSFPFRCPTCQDDEPPKTMCQHSNCTHSNRNLLCECCPSNWHVARGTSAVGRADANEESVTEVNATMVRSIQVSMRSKKKHECKTKRFNLNIETASLLGSLFLGGAVAKEPPRVECQGWGVSMTNSSPRDTRGATDSYLSLPRRAKSVSPCRPGRDATSRGRNCPQDENLTSYDSSFSMRSVPGRSQQGRHLKRLMSHFYHDLFTLPSRGDPADVMDYTYCDDVDGCCPAKVSLSTNTNRSNTALAQPTTPRTFPKANGGKSPPRCCKGRSDCGCEQMETCCRRSNGNDKYFFESSKNQKCGKPCDFLVGDACDSSCRKPHSSTDCCKRCFTALDTCDERISVRKAEKCFSFQCSDIDDSTHIPDTVDNHCTHRTSVCPTQPCTPRTSACHAQSCTPKTSVCHAQPCSSRTGVCHAQPCTPRTSVCHAQPCSSRTGVCHAQPCTPRTSVCHAQPCTLKTSVCHADLSPRSRKCGHAPVTRDSMIEDLGKKTRKSIVSCESAAHSSESFCSLDSTVNETRNIHCTHSCSNSYVSTLHVVARGSCKVRFCKKTTAALRRRAVCGRNLCVRRETRGSDTKCLVFSEPCCCPEMHENCKEFCCRTDKERLLTDTCCPLRRMLTCPKECEEKVVHKSGSSKCSPNCCKNSCKQKHSGSCIDDHTSCCDNKQMCYAPNMCYKNSQHICHLPTVLCDHPNKLRCKESNCEEKSDIERCSSVTNDKKQKCCKPSCCPSTPDPVPNDGADSCIGGKEKMFMKCKKVDRSQVCERVENNPCDFMCHAEDKCLSSDSSKEKVCSLGLNDTKPNKCPIDDKRLHASPKNRSRSQYEKTTYSQSEILQRYKRKDLPESRGISNREKHKRFMCSEERGKAASFSVASTGNAALNKPASCIKRKSPENSPRIIRKSSENTPCIMKKSAETGPRMERKSSDTSPCIIRKSAETTPSISRKSEETYKRALNVTDPDLDEVSSDEWRFPCIDSNCPGCSNHIPFKHDGQLEITKKETFPRVVVATARHVDREHSSTQTSSNTSDDTGSCKVCNDLSETQDSSESNTKSLRIKRRESGSQNSIITSKSSISQDQTHTPPCLCSIRIHSESDQPWSPCLPNFICPTQNANEQTYMQYKRLLGYWESQCTRTLDGTNLAEKSSDTLLNKRSVVSAQYLDETLRNSDTCSSHERSENGGRRSIVITPLSSCSNNEGKSRSCSSANRMENSAVGVRMSSNKMTDSPKTVEKLHHSSYLHCSTKKLQPDNMTSESRGSLEHRCQQSSFLDSFRKGRSKKCLSSDSVSHSKKPLSSRSDNKDVRLNEVITSSDFNYKFEVNEKPCLDHVNERPLSECIRKRRKDESLSRGVYCNVELNEKPCLDHVNERPLSECIKKRRKGESLSSDYNCKGELNQRPCLDHVEENPSSECLYKKEKKKLCSSDITKIRNTMNCLSMDSISRNMHQSLIVGCLNKKVKLANLSKAQFNKRQDGKCLSFENLSQRDNCSSVTDCRYRRRNKSPGKNCVEESLAPHSVKRRKRQEIPSYNRLNLHCPSADILNKVHSSSSDKSFKRQYTEMSCSNHIKTKEDVLSPCVDCGTKKQRGETLSSQRAEKINKYKSPCLECTKGRHENESSKSSTGISKRRNQKSHSDYLSKQQISTDCLSKRQISTDFLPKQQMSTECLSKRQMSTECLSKRHIPTDRLSKRHIFIDDAFERQMSTDFLSKRQMSTDYLPKQQMSTDYLSKRQMSTDFLSKRQVSTDGRKKRSRLQCTSSGSLNSRKTLQSPSSDRMYKTEEYKSPSFDCTGTQETYKIPSFDCTGKKETYKRPCFDCTGTKEIYKSPSYNFIIRRQADESSSSESMEQTQSRKSYNSEYIQGRKSHKRHRTGHVDKKSQEGSASLVCTPNVDTGKNMAEYVIVRIKRKSPSFDSVNQRMSYQCLSSVSLYKGRNKQSASSRCLNKERQKSIRSERLNVKQSPKSPNLNCLTRNEHQDSTSSDFLNGKVEHYKSPCLGCANLRRHKSPSADCLHTRKRKHIFHDADRMGKRDISSSDCAMKFYGHTTSRKYHVERKRRSESPPTDSTDKVQRYTSPCLDCGYHVPSQSSDRMKIICNQESPPLNFSDMIHSRKSPYTDCIDQKKRQEGSPSLGCRRKRRAKKIPSAYYMNEKGINRRSCSDLIHKGKSPEKITTPSLDSVSKNEDTPVVRTNMFEKNIYSPCRDLIMSDACKIAWDDRAGASKKSFKCLSSSSEECSPRTTSHKNHRRVVKRESTTSGQDATSVKFNACTKFSSPHISQKHNYVRQPAMPVVKSSLNECSVVDRSSPLPCLACSRCSKSSSDTVDNEKAKGAQRETLHRCLESNDCGHQQCLSSVSCVSKANKCRSSGRNSSPEQARINVCNEKHSPLACNKQVHQGEEKKETLKIEKDRSFPRPCTRCSEKDRSFPRPCTSCSEKDRSFPRPCTSCSEKDRSFPRPCTSCSEKDRSFPRPCTRCSEKDRSFPRPCTSCSEKGHFPPRPCTSCSRSINSSTDEQKCVTVHTSHKKCASHKIPLSLRCPGSNECLVECSKNSRSFSSCLGESHRFSKWHCVCCQPASDIVPPSRADIKCSKKDTKLVEYSLSTRSKENKKSVSGVSHLNSSSAAIKLFYNLEAPSSSHSSSPGKFPEPTLLLSSSSHVTSDGLQKQYININGRIDFPFTEKGKELLSSGISDANVSSVLSGKLFSCATHCSISSDESEDSDDEYGVPNLCLSYDDCLSLSESEGCQSQNCSYPTNSKNHAPPKPNIPTSSQMATIQSASPAPVPRRRFSVKRISPVSQASNASSERRKSQARSPANQRACVGSTTPLVQTPNTLTRSDFSQAFTAQKPFESQGCLKLKQQGSMDLGKNGVKETSSIRYNDKHLVKYPLKGFKRCTSLPARTSNAVGRTKKHAAPRDLHGTSYVSTLTNIEENKPSPGTDLTNVIKRLENCDSKEFWKILYDVKNGRLDENCLRESLAGKISGFEYTTIKTRETVGTKTLCTARKRSDALWATDYVTSAAREGRAYRLARTKSKDSCFEGRSRSKFISSSRPHSTNSQLLNSKTVPECDIDNMIMSTEWEEKTNNQNFAVWEEQNNKSIDTCGSICEVGITECRFKPVKAHQSNERACNERHIVNSFITDEFIPENTQEQKEFTRNCKGKNSPKSLANEMADNTQRFGARGLKTSHDTRSPPRMGLNGSNISKCVQQAQSRRKGPTQCIRELSQLLKSIPDDDMVSPTLVNTFEEHPTPPSIKTCVSGTQACIHDSEAACAQEVSNQDEKPAATNTGLNNTKRRAPCRPLKRNLKQKKHLARVSSSSTSQKPLGEKLPGVPKKANKIKYISRFHKPLSSKFKTTVTSSIVGESSVVRLPLKKKKANAEPKKRIAKSALPPSSSLSSLSSNASESSAQKIQPFTKKHRAKHSSRKVFHKSCSKAKSRCLKCKFRREKALLKSMPPNIGCDFVSDLCSEYLDVLQHMQHNIKLLKTVSKVPSPGSVASSQNSPSDNSSYPQCESSDISGNYFPYSGHQHSSRHPAKQDFFGEVNSRRRNYIQSQPRCTRIFQHKKNGDIDLGYKYKVLKNVLKLYRKNFLHRSRSLDNTVERQHPTRPEKHTKLQASCLSSSSWSDTLDDEPTSQSKKTNKFNHQMPKFSPSAERLLCQMCSPCRKRTIRWGLGDKDLPITKTAFHELKSETNPLEADNDRLFDAETPPGSSGVQDNQCCPLCKRKPNTLITTLDILKGISKTVSSRKDDCCWRPNSPSSLNQCSPTCVTRDESRQAYDPCHASMEKEAQEEFYEAKVLPKTFQPAEQTPDIQQYADLKRRLERLKSKQTTGPRGHDKRKKTRKRDTTQTPLSNVRRNKQTKSLAKGSGLAKYSSGPIKYGSGLGKYSSGLTKYSSAPNTLMGMPSKLSPEYFNKSGLIEKKNSSAVFPGSSPRLNNVTGTGYKSIVTVDHFESFNLNKYAIHNPATAVHPRNISNNVDFYKQNKTLLQGSQNVEPNFGSMQAASPQCSNYVQNKIDELKQFIAASSSGKREHHILTDETKCLAELKPAVPRRLASTSESSVDIEQPSPPSPKNVHAAHPITLLQDLVRDKPKSQSASKAEEESPVCPVDDAAGKQCSDHTLAASKKQDAVVQCELKRSRLRTPKKNPEESPNNRAILIILNNNSKKERNESQNRKSGLKNMNVLGQIDNGLDTKILENDPNVPPEKRLQGACGSTSKCQNVNDPDASKAGLKVEELDVIYKSANERNSSLSGENAWHNSVPNNGNPEDDDLRTEAINTDISFL